MLLPPPKKVGKIPILWYCTLFWRSRLDEKKSTVKTIVFTHLSKGWLKKVDGWKVTLSNLILMVNCIFNDLGYFYFIMTISKLNLVRWGSKRQRWKMVKHYCVLFYFKGLVETFYHPYENLGILEHFFSRMLFFVKCIFQLYTY